MTEQKRERPSRRHAYLSNICKWLKQPNVLKIIIWIARLIWCVYKLLFKDDPWTFYVNKDRRI